MLRSRKEKQQGMEVVILEQMVPENHLLAKNRPQHKTSHSLTSCVPHCTVKT